MSTPELAPAMTDRELVAVLRRMRRSGNPAKAEQAYKALVVMGAIRPERGEEHRARW